MIKTAKRKEKVNREFSFKVTNAFHTHPMRYCKLTKKCGISPSMSRRENPHDNALAENIFSISKQSLSTELNLPPMRSLQPYRRIHKILQQLTYLNKNITNFG